MERRYKPLRPAIPSPTASESGQGSRSQSSAPFKRKRVQVKVACDICRLKKSACDGQRPVCTSCQKRGTACYFGGKPAETSDSSPSFTPNESDRPNDAADFVGLLASVPPEEALDMLVELRSNSDMSAALKQVKFSRDLQEYSQPSFFPPPDQDSIEFELMTRHPILYPASVPLDFPHASAPSKSHPSQTDGAEIDLYGSHSDVSPYPSSLAGIRDPDESPLGDIPMLVAPPLEVPIFQALYDPRLEGVSFANWTEAPVNDLEASQAISDYLRFDHPILGFFDADLFLNDLSNNGTRFCSSLLVNSLLSWAYVGRKHDGVQPATINDFYTLALATLPADHGIDSLNKLAALNLLSLTATYQGHGKMATKLLKQAIEMGKRMRLLADSATPTNLPIPSGPEGRAACHAAWGLFSYATIHSLHCQQCELGATSAPTLPIPTSSAELDTAAAKRPADSVPSYIGLTFEHLCRLCVIIHDMVVKYYSRDSAQWRRDAAHMDSVGVLFRRFLNWGHDLPLPLARGNKSTHHGLILHIYFHAAIISLLRPLVFQQHHETTLGLSSADERPAEAVSSASVSQLKRLMVLYQSRSSAEMATVHWHTACLYVANAVIRRAGEANSRRSYLYRCLEGYKTLYPRYAVSVPIFKGLLSMAVSNGLMTSQEAYEYLSQLLAKKEHPSPVAGPTESCFMVDLDLALTDQVAAHIDSLAQRFDDMVMFDNFTHGRADEDGGVSVALP